MASLALGSGGKGRMQGTGQGSGKGPQPSGQYWQQPEYPENWKCPCGYYVWPRKTICPKCEEPRVQDTKVVGPTKGQGASSQGLKERPGQAAPGTLEEDKEELKALTAKRKIQIKAINKTLADWPGGGRDSAAYAALRQEEEALTAALLADQPTDIQLLTAKEQVNATRRKILKSEAKRDKAQVEADSVSKELEASRAAHDVAESRLDKMEAAFKVLTVTPKEEPGITEEEQEMLKKVRLIRIAYAGDLGSLDYQQAIADIIPKSGPGQGAAEAPKAIAAHPGQGSWAARTTPQGRAAGGAEAQGDGQGTPSRAGGTARPATIPTPARGSTEEGSAHKKRGAELGPAGLKTKEEAELQGTAMEDVRGDAPQGPWPPLQDEPQDVIPMDLTGGEDFSAKEVEAWEKSKTERAKERDMEAAAGLASAAGRQEAPPEPTPPGGRGTGTVDAAEAAASVPGQGNGKGKKDPSEADEDDDAEPKTFLELKDPDIDDTPEDPPEDDI
jgi:hypothetical protein